LTFISSFQVNKWDWKVCGVVRD